MDKEISRLQNELAKVYNGKPWYGRSVKSVLDEIPAGQAYFVSGNHHSNASLVAHMIAWRTYVLKRLSGDDTFELETEETFRWQRYGEKYDPVWEKMLAELDRSQQDLLKVIGDLAPERLDEQAGNLSYTCRELIEGVIRHDIYHIGQIVFYRKYFASVFDR